MEPQVTEAEGRAEGEAQAEAAFTIIVEASGHAKGSALQALRQMHAAVNELDDE